MLGKEIKSKRYVPLYEVKDLMKERAERGELNYEQAAVSEYSKKHAKIAKTKGDKLLKDLLKYEELDDKTRIKIADILPVNVERLRILLPKTANYDDAKLKEIIGLVESYL